MNMIWVEFLVHLYSKQAREGVGGIRQDPIMYFSSESK